ncbi:MAG: sugar ABC transporter permease [Treponema sp.]|jgi:multiple sugar transport system permease protein|nr:sugar ABC transporter permease [Treponema sp.]
MKMSLLQKRNIEGYSFIFPGMVYILALLGYPLIYNFILGFRDVNVRTFKSGADVFVGFSNYIELFRDATFRLVLRNSFVFTFACIAVQFTLGFLLALFFSKKFKLAGPVRGLILIAYMMPMSVTALLGKNMFGQIAVINDLLSRTGLVRGTWPMWLADKTMAMNAVIAVNCWVGIPFNMLLLTSGLTNVPNEIYESAAIDGAGAWTRFWKITVPCIKSSIFAVLMLGFIYTFKAFDLMFIMTAGGPLNATDVLGTYSYRLSFTEYKFSMGSASAIILFFCLFFIGLLYLKISLSEDQ